jgi:hypothetical protein
MSNPEKNEVEDLWQKTLAELRKRTIKKKNIQIAKKKFDENPTEENWSAYLELMNKCEN